MPADFLTIADLIKRTTDFFTTKGIESAKTDAEWIVSDVLGCKRLELYLRFDKLVPEDKLPILREYVRRRGAREPLQQILGFVEWGNLRLSVDRRCLVPRPETEELWANIVEHFADLVPPASIVDLGTGSGALALALKKSFPEAAVTAVERNPDTLALAKENAAANSLSVNFVQSDWFTNLPLPANSSQSSSESNAATSSAPSASMSRPVTVIVSNPPYLTDAEWETAQPEVKDWEPKEALTASNEGLADLLYIMEQARAYLAEGGQLWLEHGIAHADALSESAKQLEYASIEHYKDSNHRVRFTRLVR